MPRRRPRRAAGMLAPLGIAALLGVLVAACGSSPSPTPALATPVPTGATLPPVSAIPFTSTSYPETGPAPCGVAPYGGELKRITAVDARTVVFELCSADVAFLAKIASPAFSINDSASLKLGVATLGKTPNGTGPYVVRNWVAGEAILFAPNPKTLGPKAPANLLMSWSAEPAQRVLELRQGTVDGIDDVSTRDVEAVQADPGLQLLRRPGLTAFGLAMSNATGPFGDERVRQAVAMAIDRQAIVEQLLPAGFEVATHFAPCVVVGGCEGARWYDFDVPQAKQLLAAAGLGSGFKTTIHVDDATHAYVPNEAAVVDEIVKQLKANLNIEATLDSTAESTYAANAAAGKLDGIHVVGVESAYADASAFLDPFLRTGAGAELGKAYTDIAAALTTAASTLDPGARRAAYKQANELLRAHAPIVPVAHGGSMLAFRADVQGAHPSPMGTETFAAMTPTGRTQLVFMQAGEPPSLYCADEPSPAVLRACAQFADGLYAYRQGAAEPEPDLATGCVPDKALTTWTCTLRDAVQFANGASLDATDVLETFAAQWDMKHPLHKGRTSEFRAFASLFGGFLNPPAVPE
jgi:peptide/nickel transport system substrate-binding protein